MNGNRVRVITFGVLAGIATLLTGLLTIGATVQLFGAGLADGERLAFLTHAPWLGLGWCAGFAALVWRGTHRVAALQQLLAMLVGLYVGGIVILRENDPVFYVGFGVVLAALVLLHPHRRTVLRPGPAGVSPALLVLSLVISGPVFVYAERLTDLIASTGTDAPFYTGVVATAVAVPLVGLAASLRGTFFRLPGWTAAIMLASLGVGSLVFSDPATLSAPAAVAALLGALALAGATEREAHADARPVVSPGSVPATGG